MKNKNVNKYRLLVYNRVFHSFSLNIANGIFCFLFYHSLFHLLTALHLYYHYIQAKTKNTFDMYMIWRYIRHQANCENHHNTDFITQISYFISYL